LSLSWRSTTTSCCSPDAWRDAGATQAWLTDHGIDHQLLVVRPLGNRRPAAEVKVGFLAVLARDRRVAVLVDDDEAVTTAAASASYPVRLAQWGRPSESLHRAQEVEGRS